MKDAIVQMGDPLLRKVAKEIPKKDITSRKIKAVIKRMKTLLNKEEHGVAIAAPQIGESLRLFVVAEKVFAPDDEPEDGAPKKAHAIQHEVFINPVILRSSRAKREMAEGCLSVRGTYGTVLRHERASVKALDEYGMPFTHHGTGLLAHIFQHEIDHLDGILYVDKAEKMIEDEKLPATTPAREELRKKYPA